MGVLQVAVERWWSRAVRAFVAWWRPRLWLRRLWSNAIVREARSPLTLVVLVLCVTVGIPVTTWLAPEQDVTVAGQPISVGVRDPSLSWSGPAQLVQIGNTEFDIAALRVKGPLRPKLTLGPVQRNAGAAAVLDPKISTRAKANAAVNTIGSGFARWYGWATLILLGITVAAIGGASSIRMLVTLRRLSGPRHEPVPLQTVLRHSVSQLAGMSVIAILGTMLVWAGAGYLAYDGAASGLQQVRSVSDLVGTYHLSPSAVGPRVRGYDGVVIGDSRASRLGGPTPEDATPEDQACARSTDSLAHEIGDLTDTQVLNLACSGASITNGLRQSQTAGANSIPPQVGRLKQVEDLRFVVVVIGPNDLYWADFLRYCYGVENCQDNLTQGEFAYRLAAFDLAFGELLLDLSQLEGNPQVIMMTSYDAFKPDADCEDTTWPGGQGRGLSPDNLLLLANMNQQLNDVLAIGAEKYGFTVATPKLTPLCEPGHPLLGPDLQGLDDSSPFHPTALGIVRMAASVARVLEPQAGTSTGG